MLSKNHDRVLAIVLDDLRAIEIDANRIKTRCRDARIVVEGLNQIHEFATASCATMRVSNETRIIAKEVSTMMRHLSELIDATHDLTQIEDAVQSKSQLKRLAIQKGE